MSKILVIADDLTGSAEIGAAATRFGLRAVIVRDGVAPNVDADVVVIDTDSRNLSPADAGPAVARALDGLDLSRFEVVFKKTDSVLRGPVLAELSALMRKTGRTRTLLIPQNPSRGRTIVGGTYCVAGKPLAQTSFASDLTHPALTSDVIERLDPSSADVRVTTRDLGEGDAELADRTVTVGNAATVDDVKRWASRASPDILPAGGINFFESVLSTGRPAQKVDGEFALDGRVLVVCGSTCPRSRAFVAGVQQIVPTFRVPYATDLPTAIERSRIAVLAGPVSMSTSTTSIAMTTASAVAKVLEHHPVDHLLLEGGTTSSAVCRAMGWSTLAVEGEVEPGVARLRPVAPDAPQLVLKPGSYEWPASVNDFISMRASSRTDRRVACGQ